MLVTLNDGAMPLVYDTAAKEIIGTRSLAGGHWLRLHVYEPTTRTAYQKFVTYDRALQDEIMNVIIQEFGAINSGNTWIRNVIKRREFWDTSNESAMVRRDLERYFGDAVTIRGTSQRYIWYMSDGRIETTPDAIGMAFRHPLVYKGYAMATIFDIAGLNPLSPGSNVVHWLTKPMWVGFHSRLRKIPKDFPWPTGFIATYWCQREGYGTYGKGGIRIASMTQGQSVGRWASTSLRQFWIERQGHDIFEKFGKSYKVDKGKGSPVKTGAGSFFNFMMLAAGGGTPYGLIGLYCARCGTPLKAIYSECHKCHMTNSTYDLTSETMCTRCGKSQENICECGKKHCSTSRYGCECEHPEYVRLSLQQHKTQYAALKKAYYYSAESLLGAKGGSQYDIEYAE